MGIANAIFGTASQINADELSAEFAPMLIEGEQITGAFKVYRDLIVFTQVRMIFADKQGVTGKKIEYHSIPYKSISQFSVETAGHFDMDSELKVYISSDPTPYKKEFKKGTDIVEVQRLLATYILTQP